MSDTHIVGILNITPDSFSDGGAYFSPEAALQAAQRLHAEGASIIDIGAESTRPGATPLSADEEWRRLSPVLAAFPASMPFSVDTRHAFTAGKALAAGAQWINDVSGFSDGAMVEAVRPFACKLVVMHSLGVPADAKRVLPESADVVETLLQFARERIGALEKAGIARDRIIFDPGLGFGKTAVQSLDIARRVDALSVLGVPLLVGHSRKSFLSAFGDRDGATLALSQWLVEKKIAFLRVHDVARHRQMLTLMEALNG